jgi:glucose/arabinose dehydrogenase
MKLSSSPVAAGLALSVLATRAMEQSSCGPAPSGNIQPSIASGYSMQVVATGLSKPRGIILDQAGNLLVVEQGRGAISAHTLRDNNGCVSIGSSSDVTPSMDVRGS